MCYEVLVRISPGYPSVTGRLHTRYSPVRRSPPKYCYPVLPLDLHVLSLSLAFILSQDQTLRCMISFTFFHNLLARDGDFYSSRTTFFVYCNFFKDRLLFSFENGLQI